MHPGKIVLSIILLDSISNNHELFLFPAIKYLSFFEQNKYSIFPLVIRYKSSGS